MQRDLRLSLQYREALLFQEHLLGTGVWDARDISLSPDARTMLFAGLRAQRGIETGSACDIYRYDFVTGARRLLRTNARLASYSPDAKFIALVAEDSLQGRIEIFDPVSGATLKSVACPGVVERLAWAPDGQKLLLIVAENLAEQAGLSSGTLSTGELGPYWLPEILTPSALGRRRRLHVWTANTGALEAFDQFGINVWEASWLGNRVVAAVSSADHAEGSWYGAALSLIDVCEARAETVYRPENQIGLPAGQPSGCSLAFIEARCSDRGLVCGTLRILDITSRTVRSLPVEGTDVSSIAWGTDGRILYAGLRGLQTVIGWIDPSNLKVEELWSSTSMTCGEWLPTAYTHGDRALAVFEGYQQQPFIGFVSDGRVDVAHQLDGRDPPAGSGNLSPCSWRAADGLQIEGLLLHPHDAREPLALLLDVHGGPIWAHRCRWMARLRAAPLLAQRGCATLFPNPRGSSGRGQDFAERVLGDMGGLDAADCLAGIDDLIARGVVDPARTAISGGSYGGFLTASLVGRTRRFAAAIAISPIANWYSQHFGSQIPSFDVAFLRADPYAAGGPYFERSPVFSNKQVTTPTLILAGGLDRHTPPGQALELYNTLVAAGALTTLAVYPGCGHGVGSYPEYLDSIARIVIWLEQHLLRRDGPVGVRD